MTAQAYNGEETLDFVFEAAHKGLRIAAKQERLMEIWQGGFDDSFCRACGVHSPDAQEEEDELLAQIDELETELSTTEVVVAERLRGTTIVANVLPGDGSRSIRAATPYINSGSYRISNKNYHKIRGQFSVALLGQNALTLYPQKHTGRQLIGGIMLVPLLRGDGSPNVALTSVPITWDDRLLRNREQFYREKVYSNYDSIRIVVNTDHFRIDG